MKTRKPGYGIPFLAGVGLFFVSLAVAYLFEFFTPKQKMTYLPALTGEQIRRLGAEAEKFRVNVGRRPIRLQELIAGGYLEPRDFFDPSRSPTPADEVGQLTMNPDVIYFPALAPEDPPDTVLLCTIFLPARKARFRVVFNDGRYAELPAGELVASLQRTYTYLGAKVARNTPPGPPALAEAQSKPQ